VAQRASTDKVSPMKGLTFTFAMTIATQRTNLATLWVFITLTATYLLLVLAELGVASSSLRRPLA
jgi:succinate-acetate transporter protein